MTINEKQDEIIDDFSLFDEWMDKYENIIDYGREVKGLSTDEKTDENLIRGCQSQVWLTSELKEDKLYFNADSDAVITKGIIGLLLEIYSGHTPQDIATTELYAIDKIGLKEHLSPNRANGLTSMINKIKMTALAYRAKQNS